MRSAVKQIKRSTLVKRADKAFSEYIRERDGYQCFTCGLVGAEKDGVMQCGHLFTRVSHSTRWDELNSHCQCRGCNMLHEHDPHRYTSRFIEKYGLMKYEELYAKHKQTGTKFSNADLLLLEKLFLEKLNRLKAWREI